MWILGRLVRRLRLKSLRKTTANKVYVGGGSFFDNVEMGDFSYCGYNCRFQNVVIGKFCSIADDVVIGGAHHHLDKVSTSPIFYDRSVLGPGWGKDPRERIEKTLIQHDVWIGSRAIILSGVSIATGAVIGAGSVVTKDVGPYEIWAGAPAVFVRCRFGTAVVSQLLDSYWWNKPDHELQQAAVFADDPVRFVEVLSKTD